jgi:hypothetical protein
LIEDGGDREAFFAGADRKRALIRDFHILRMWPARSATARRSGRPILASTAETSAVLGEM